MTSHFEPMDTRICIAKITQPHGIKGLVKLMVFIEDASLLANDYPLYRSEKGENKLPKITLKNPMGKYWLAALENVTTREMSESLQGTEIWASRDILPPPEDGEFYYSDLTGLAVKNSDKETIGSVIAVQNFGAGDLLEIKPASGPSYYLPFNDDCVPHVDLDNKRVIVNIPDGLIDEKSDD